MKKKHEVVINDDYGSFGISGAAVTWLEANAQDQKLLDFLKGEREKITKEFEEEGAGKSSVTGKPFTIEEIMGSTFTYGEGKKIFPRHHPDFVAVVKALKKKVNTSFSHLKVVKLKGNKYRIEGYDGWEHVMEPEDYEFITIEE